MRRDVLFALMLGLASGAPVVAGASPGPTARVPASAASAPFAATSAQAARGPAAAKTLAVVDATETAAGRRLLGRELRMVLDPEQPLAARQTRFNPAPGCGRTLRWGTMPFDFGNGQYEFSNR